MATTLPEGVTLVDHPLVHVKLARLREQSTPSTDFRRKLSELASLLMFEATRDLPTLPTEVQTPLALCAGKRLARPVILAPILRAGLGMIEGMSHVLSDVSIGHIGMFR
ncbi:MAG: uracil phosphoribosyltransferase, partial [Verrucomicrobiota bacterium]|nr:uracil phosphoribosyltransferase [Verrucomicrobiota bacterium]